MEIGTPELLIILVIIVMLFGVGRITKIGSELGEGLREFRRGLQGDEEQTELQQQPVEESEHLANEESNQTLSS
jgi:sec-independent protein translocase protein TatA